MSELEIGMVGLGVMGQNLALNIDEKGFSVRRLGRLAGAGRQVRGEGEGKARRTSRASRTLKDFVRRSAAPAASSCW